MELIEDKCIEVYGNDKSGQDLEECAKSKSIYIFLARTNTVMSNIIHYITKSEYTHAGISFDMKMNKLYSFSRVYTNNPFIGGFMHENVEQGVYAKGKRIPCAVYELKVSERVYNSIEDKIEIMMSEQRKYRYNLKGLIYHYFNVQTHRPYHYFCSEFVAETLLDSGATDFDMIPSLTKPRDLKSIPSAKLVFCGDIKELKSLSM